MKGSVKANTVDRYLRPIREQIVELTDEGAEVLELGCGNGDLLFKLSSKLKSGVGIDSSSTLINYAKSQTNSENHDHLEFKEADVLTYDLQEGEYSLTIASLLYHVLPIEEAKVLLKRQIEIAPRTIICGFSKPGKPKDKVLLWLDQRFNRHYPHFKMYARQGYMRGLLASIGNADFEELDTFDPVIKLYVIRRRHNALKEL